jgi:hypothetical protein
MFCGRETRGVAPGYYLAGFQPLIWDSWNSSLRKIFLRRKQNSAFPSVRAKGITSRMFETPVRNISGL